MTDCSEEVTDLWPHIHSIVMDCTASTGVIKLTNGQEVPMPLQPTPPDTSGLIGKFEYYLKLNELRVETVCGDVAVAEMPTRRDRAPRRGKAGHLS